MDSLQVERRDVINTTLFWTGSKDIDLQHWDNQLWSRVFNSYYGPCFTFDLSNVEEFKYVQYEKLGRPDVTFFLNKNIPWKKIRILFLTFGNALDL